MILHSLSEQRVTKVSIGSDLFQPSPMWLSGQQRGPVRSESQCMIAALGSQGQGRGGVEGNIWRDSE